MTRRTVTERLLRVVEADFYKMLGRTPKQPQRTRDFVDELLANGASAKTSARAACAADAEDPTVCAVPIPKTPNVSMARSKHQPFESPPVFTKPCCGAKSSPPKSGPVRVREAPPVIRSARELSLHLGQTEQGSSVDWSAAEQTNAFMLITGGSGSGKSELLRSIGGQVGAEIPTIIFDVHGDLTLPGFTSHRLGKSLGVNPLNQPAPDVGQRVREFVSTMRIAVPGLGSRQQLILSETAREVCRAERCDLGELRKQLQEQQGSKSADRNSVFGLLASLDVVFGEPVFEATNILDPRVLLTGAHRLDLTQLVRPAQVLVIETLLRWLFEAIRSAGPVSSRGLLRVFAICDEAALLRGSEVLDILFREARKFGLGMALASQLAADFGPALRANAGTIFTLRANSAAEVNANARELGISPVLVGKLSRPGQALLRDSSGIRAAQIERWPFKQPTLFPTQTMVGSAKPAKPAKSGKTTYDPQELEVGRRIELEHTKNPKVAERIAKDHLREIPDYYSRLQRMEAEAKTESSVTAKKGKRPL